MSLYSATTVSSSNSGLTSHSSWYPWCSVLLLNHTRDLADVFLDDMNAFLRDRLHSIEVVKSR